MAVEHAECYGIERDEDGEWEWDEPECWIAGIYDPEQHDMHRSGGGSFLNEEGVKEALGAYRTLEQLRIFTLCE